MDMATTSHILIEQKNEILAMVMEHEKDGVVVFTMSSHERLFSFLERQQSRMLLLGLSSPIDPMHLCLMICDKLHESWLMKSTPLN